MSSPGVYTPKTAAEVLKCTEQEVVNHIKAGRLKATFLSNVGDYVIVPGDLMSFLKATQNTRAVRKLSTPRVLVVDRDPRLVDLLRMELGRQGCQVRVATTNSEISLRADDFMPDVICIHLGSVTRPKDPIKEGLERARRVSRCFVILYHNWSAHVTMTPEMGAQIESVRADVVVVLDRSITPLLEAVREKLGLRAPRPAPPRPS